MTQLRAVVPGFLVLSLVLGGASAAGFESNMLLQLIAVGLIAVALVARQDVPMSSSARQLLALLALMLALIAVQLVPLPPSLWSALPGRAAISEGFRMLGVEQPWLPLSLAPQRTIASALWLLPAIAALIAMLRMDTARLNWFAWTIVGVTMVAVPIGALQTASGERSPWYFYEITNYGVGTGFFSNANHMATLLVVTVPFLAALYLHSRSRGGAQRASTMSIVVASMLLVDFIGLAVNRSIAGLGLVVPVLAASGLMIASRKRSLPRWWVLAVGLLVAGSVVVAFSAPFGNNLTSSEARTSQESRYTSFGTTLRAARDYLPVGTGAGTFVQIYPSYENPADTTTTYMNHAHSDLLELTLETGVPGLILIALFLSWWTWRTIAIWREEDPNHFARAATIATAAMLAHSLVDYPLRTAGLSTLFAVCLAIMADPRPRPKRTQGSTGQTEARHLSAD